MPPRKRRTLKSKIEMAKISCPKKIPIVVLERLQIDKINKSCKTVAKVVLDKKDCIVTDNTEVKELRNKVVDIKKKSQKPKKVKRLNSNVSVKLFPRVVLERLVNGCRSTNAFTREDVAVSEKPDDSTQISTKCPGTLRKTRRKTYEVTDKDKLDSTKHKTSSINKENLTSNVTNQQRPESSFEKNLSNQVIVSQEASSTEQPLPLEEKSDLEKESPVVANENASSEHTLPNLVSTESVQKENDKVGDTTKNNSEEASGDPVITHDEKKNEVDDEIIDILSVDDEMAVEKAIENVPLQEDKTEEIKLVDEGGNCPNEEVNLNKNDLPSRNENLKASYVNEIIDSSDIITDNSSYEEESSAITDDEDETDNGSEIGEFLPLDHSENSANPSEIFTQKMCKSSSGAVNRKPDQSLKKNNYLYISLKDAYESISADMNSLDEMVCTYEASYEDCGNEDVCIEECTPEVLDVPSNSDGKNDCVMIDQSHSAINNLAHHSVSSTLEKRLNFVRKSQSLNCPDLYNSKPNDQSRATSSKGSPRKRISIRIARCPKCKKKYTDVNFARHWDMCRIGPYVPCMHCDNKFFQKRSLIRHLKNHHRDRVHEADVVRIANNAYLKARVALTKLKKLPTEMLEIQVPEFIRVYCKICYATYNTLPSNYRKSCYDCSKILTYHCNRCHTHGLTDHRMAHHLRSECEIQSSMYCAGCRFDQEHESAFRIKQQAVVPLPPPSPPSLLIPSLPGQPSASDQICDRCGKEFTHKALQKHKSHCCQTAISCKFCNFESRHRSVLKMHMQQHVINNDRPMVRDDDVRIIEGRWIQSTVLARPVSDFEKAAHETHIESMIGRCCLKCGSTGSDFRYACPRCDVPYQFTCMVCKTISTKHCLMKHHVARQHAPKIFVCANCAGAYSLELDFKNHCLQCKVLFCNECNYRTTQYGNLWNHQKRRHPNPDDLKYNCPHCTQVFALQDSLKKHLTRCGSEPKLICAHCSFRTYTKYSLKRHLQSRHAVEILAKRYNCDNCRKIFYNLFSYESHIKKCAPSFRDFVD